MSDITILLSKLDRGDPSSAEQLLQLVYDELRFLAAAEMSREKSGQTLQPTALVHEAYLRLAKPAAGADGAPQWQGRRHFFAAAAEAMRRILIDRARQKAALKRGGNWQRAPLDEHSLASVAPPEQLVELDEALQALEAHDPSAAQLIKLRYLAGLSHQEAAEVLQISRRAADRLWTLARTWLFKRLNES